jgi:hypothetical protein
MVRGQVIILIGFGNDDLFGSGNIGVIDTNIGFS